MSNKDYPWHDLKIEKTDDKRTIKRAYTKILKTIDVETDPEAFIALREAYDYALGPAQWVDEGDDYYDIDQAVDQLFGTEGTVDQAEIVQNLLSRIDGELDVDDDEEESFDIEIVSSASINENLSALNKLLNSSTDETLDTSAIKSHYRTIQSDPALELLTVADSVEMALADMVIYADQSVATLLRLANRDYDWAKRANMIGLQWPISQAAEMADAQRWLDKQENGGDYEDELKILLNGGTPHSSRFDRFISSHNIDDFIDEMDANYPGAAFLLNQDTIDAWRQPPEEFPVIWGTAFNYFVCLPIFVYALSLQFSEQYNLLSLDDISFRSFIKIMAFANLFIFFAWLKKHLINDQVSIENIREGITKPFLVEIMSYVCLLSLPIIAILMPHSLITTISLALLSGAAVIGSGVHYTPNPNGFIAHWYLRLGPLLCILLLISYQMKHVNVQVLIPVYALIWVMIYSCNRFDELRFILHEKSHRISIWAIIIAGIGLFIGNLLGPEYSLFNIGFELSESDITYYKGIMAMLAITLCAITEFFYVREDVEIEINFYIGYIFLLAIILFFAVPVACLFCIVRMREVLDSLG